MSKSSRKKLIAVGCSYTESWNSWKSWPTVLAEKLDMDCVNLGRSGAGNQQILSNILDTALFADGVARMDKKDIGLVVVMWSEWQRMGFQMYARNWHHWWNVQPMRHNPLPRGYRVPDFKKNVNDWAHNLLGAQNPHHTTQANFRIFIQAEKLLENIPRLYIQGCDVIGWYNTTTLKYVNCDEFSDNTEIEFTDVNDSRPKVVREVIRSPYFHHIDENISKYFIGWPIFQELGGYCVNNILDRIDPNRIKLRISESDSHPNSRGHRIIAQEIYDAYAKIYT